MQVPQVGNTPGFTGATVPRGGGILVIPGCCPTSPPEGASVLVTPRIGSLLPWPIIEFAPQPAGVPPGPKPLLWSGISPEPQPPECCLLLTVLVLVGADRLHPPVTSLPSCDLSRQSILPAPSLLSSMFTFRSSHSLMLIIQFLISSSCDLRRHFFETSSLIVVPACRCQRMWLELTS